jgi:hypothetical protein
MISRRPLRHAEGQARGPRSDLQSDRGVATKPTGVSASRSGGAEAGGRRPERGPEAHGSPGHRGASGPVRKSLGGTGGTRGTARPAKSKPRSRIRPRPAIRRNGRISRAYTRGRRGGETAGGSGRHRRDAGHARDEINTAKGTSEPHGRRRASKDTRPGRDNSPNRGPGTCAEGKAATNDPRGRRLPSLLDAITRRREAPKTARARSNDPREPTVGVGVGRSNQRRSGMVRRPVAFGRYGAASERRRERSETS